MTASALCPRCHSAGIIATTGGPTCRHGERTGAAWFPDWWHAGPFDPAAEKRRCEWLQSRFSDSATNPPPTPP